MDPDAALRDALSLPDPDERQRAARDLHGWLSHGGFPPSEQVVRELGIIQRVALLSDRSMHLEKYRNGWCVGFKPYGCPTTYVRLRT